MTVTGADGSRVRGSYRLITTLLDHRRFPAAAVVRLYHERWEIESAYFALRHTLLEGRVLRSGDRPGLEQETWALLTLYQLLRMAMVTAIETRPGTDPDRASFTTAMEAAKDQLTAAAGICPDGPADLTGAIGRAVLATLLPARRLRFSARKVKCATSRYLNRDDGRPPHPAAITAIDITISTPPVDLGPAGPATTAAPPGRLARPPAGTGSPRSSPATPRASGAATTWPSSSASNPGTCSPSSANGHGWASSPAPASAPTASTRRPPIPPRQTRPILNFAALLRGCGRSSLTLAARRQDRAAARKDPEEQSAQPGGARSHRARSVCPLDNGGPYGCRRQGLPDCHGAGTSVRRCMPHGVRHPDGETDRRSRRRGRAAGTPARTIRMPPVSSIWIPGRRWALAPDHPAGRNPAGGHARERRGGAGRHGPGHQGAGRCGCPERPSSCSGITLSDEGGQGERARTRR